MRVPRDPEPWGEAWFWGASAVVGLLVLIGLLALQFQWWVPLWR